ncbi:toxin-antitoxin system YwqK family antitoxin [Winogradskyella sp. 3972H.M.0a.05]|uniref:toxin-antitoxin system YwqK family antitoxin n=1 Tax=Winogradskyella sp. 3972H.M.0a.05 TaxID=2950277 RepID=UPI00339B821B
MILLTLFVSLCYAQKEVNRYDSNGKRHGLWTKNYKNTDQVRYEGNFVHGKEVGLFKFYKLVKGKSILSATKDFKKDSDIVDVKFMSSKGKVISEGQMKGKAFVGKWLYYHNKFASVMTVEHYNNAGKLDGEKIIYFKDGKVAEKVTYKDGKREGKSVWYSEEGILLRESNYVNGELHGPSKFYDASGLIASEGVFQKDRKHGIWKFYQNGKLKEEKDFTRRSKNPKLQKKQ